jgi:hypothetical protein
MQRLFLLPAPILTVYDPFFNVSLSEFIPLLILKMQKSSSPPLRRHLVPETCTILHLGAGLIDLGFYGRRRARRG